MVDSIMHCTCGDYQPKKSSGHRTTAIQSGDFFIPTSYLITQDVCINCGLLPPIKTPGLFIQGDTYQGDDK